MYDFPHPSYLDHYHKRRLKPLNQDSHDGNPTRKDDFLDLEHLSRSRNYILIVMIFRYSSFDVDFVTLSKMMP